MEGNTRGRIFPVQFSLFNPEIHVPEPERKILEQRVKKQYKPHHMNQTWSDGQFQTAFIDKADLYFTLVLSIVENLSTSLTLYGM